MAFKIEPSLKINYMKLVNKIIFDLKKLKLYIYLCFKFIYNIFKCYIYYINFI